MMNKLLEKLLAPWRAIKAVAEPVREKFRIGRINGIAMARAEAKPEVRRFEVRAPALPPGVIPATPDGDYMALDSASMAPIYRYANSTFFGQGFPGYPYLAELTQRSEYRSPPEVIAEEMTRKWIKIVATGDGDKSDKIERIDAAMDALCVRERMHMLKLHDQFYGRGQLYVCIRGQIDDIGRRLPLIVDKATIKVGDMLGLVNIEPMWTTPFSYNSNDPTARDFFRPTSWYVLGKQTHASRLLTLVSRPVPDMLKPAYNFGGMSLTQLMQESVNSWVGVKESVSRLVRNFSITGIKTDLSSIMGEGTGSALADRIKHFNMTRDNQGLMAIQYGPEGEGEEFFQLNTPLSGLDKLQAQAQEHMAAPAHIPLVKLFGISPSGLNATGESELDVFDDHIHAMQESEFRPILQTIFDLIQLSEFGEIDPSISFEFQPLKELDGTELAAVRKSDSDAAVALVTAGIISAEEERARLIGDPNSGYNSLSADDAPPDVGDDDPGELEE